MMRSMIIVLCLTVAACSHPVEQTRALNEQPAILVRGAPDGAMLRIDGLIAGAVNTSSGQPQALRIEAGTHHVEVIVDGRPILDERVFVSGAMIKTLNIHAGDHQQ